MMENLKALLPVMIIGLVLAEFTGILGMFMLGSDYPTDQRVALICSFAAMLQYIPFYATSVGET